MNLLSELVFAIEKNDEARAQSALDLGADDPDALDEVHSDLWKALSRAANLGHDAIAKMLFLRLSPARSDRSEPEQLDEESARAAFVTAIEHGCIQTADAMAPMMNFGHARMHSSSTGVAEELTLGAESLSAAARTAREDLLHMLIKHGAHQHLGTLPSISLFASAVNGNTALLENSTLGLPALEALLSIAPDACSKEVDPWLLRKAIIRGCRLEVIEKIILASRAESFDCWENDSPSHNPIYLALAKGRAEAAQAILAACSHEQRLSICAKLSYNGDTLLLAAAKACSFIPDDLIRLSPLSHGLSEDRRFPMSDEDENTPLHVATTRETPSNAIALFARSDPQARNDAGDTPLMLLAAKKKMGPEWMAVALEWAASQPAIKNAKGESALEIAIMAENPKLALALLHSADEDDMPRLWAKMLANPLADGDDCLAAMALAARGSAKEIDGELFRMAIGNGRVEFALRAIPMIANSAILDAPSLMEASTPLMEAASLGLADVAKALLPWANAMRRDKLGRTALMLAAGRGYLECSKALLEHSDLSAVDFLGWTPLMHAVNAGNVDIVQMLSERSERETIEHASHIDKLEALSLASKNGNASCVEILLRHGATAMAGKYKESPWALLQAIESSSVAAAKALMPVSDIRATSASGTSPLLAALIAGQVGSPKNREIIDMLLPLSNLSQCDIFGDGPLENLRLSSASQEMVEFYKERAKAVEEARAMDADLPRASDARKSSSSRL